MVCRITTFAFEGVDAKPVDVQVQLAGGQPAFIFVGLNETYQSTFELDKAIQTVKELDLNPY